MSIPKKRLGDILIDCDLINEDQLKDALAYQREHGIKLGEALSEMGLVTEDDIIWALGNQLNISFIHLSPEIVNSEVVKLISSDFARDYRLMPLYKAGNEFSVCMVDPLDSRPIEYLEGKFGTFVTVSICTAFDFEQTFNAIYGPLDVGSSGGVNTAVAETEAEKQQIEQGIPRGMESADKIINYILGQAIMNSVDRIHFEPSEKGVPKIRAEKSASDGHNLPAIQQRNFCLSLYHTGRIHKTDTVICLEPKPERGLCTGNGGKTGSDARNILDGRNHYPQRPRYTLHQRKIHRHSGKGTSEAVHVQTWELLGQRPAGKLLRSHERPHWGENKGKYGV